MKFETISTDSPASLLIDTHCHLDDESYAGDLQKVLDESRAAGVSAWINVGCEPQRWQIASQMASNITGLFHMLGVHPSSAQLWNDAVRDDLVDLIVASKPRAIGEMGMDFYRDNAPFEVQRHAFTEQLAIAHDFELPAVIHVRNAETELLDVLEAEESLPRLVFHSFDGTERLTRFVLNHDAVIGVGGLATRQKSDTLREQLTSIPLESMILETDSPYLIPARQKERRNSPAHVRTVALFLAAHLNRSVEDVARITSSTAQSVFGELLP